MWVHVYRLTVILIRLQGSLNGIPWKATRILYSLETLDLQWNNIQTIKVGDLTGLVSLRILILSHNKITHLHPACFTPVGVTLTTLDLSDNEIASLSVTPFASMTALHILRLSGNRLQSLPDYLLSNVSSLTSLDVRYNQLKYVNPLSKNISSSAASQSQIVELMLNNNEIETVSMFAFSQLPNLSSVYLGNNMITKLEEHSFYR